MPALTTTTAATQVTTQKRDGRAFDEVSDAVDEGRCTFSTARHPRSRKADYTFTVNVQKLKLWDDESEFDTQKDKAHFRQYEDACDRVKNFYKEQHGTEA
jgi:inositol oxygenase